MDPLDVEHLAEEIKSLGQSDRYAVESQLVRLLLHLLKWQYDPATRRHRGWRLTIEDAREEIAKRVKGGLREHPASHQRPRQVSIVLDRAEYAVTYQRLKEKPKL